MIKALFIDKLNNCHHLVSDNRSVGAIQNQAAAARGVLVCSAKHVTILRYSLFGWRYVCFRKPSGDRPVSLEISACHYPAVTSRSLFSEKSSCLQTFSSGGCFETHHFALGASFDKSWNQYFFCNQRNNFAWISKPDSLLILCDLAESHLSWPQAGKIWQQAHNGSRNFHALSISWSAASIFCFRKFGNTLSDQRSPGSISLWLPVWMASIWLHGLALLDVIISQSTVHPMRLQSHRCFSSLHI